MKTVCFIANYFKTNVFIEVAKDLSEKGNTIYWITPNKKQYVHLVKEFSDDAVLYIGKKEVLSAKTHHLSNDLKINELVCGDRVLREEPQEWSFEYLYKLQHVYQDFIKANGIQFIFGELTWAHELLAMRLANADISLGCRFINPHTIRIPNGRFAFFTDEFQSVIKENEAESSNNETPIIKAEKPAYLALNDKFIDKKSTFGHNVKLLMNFMTRANQDANDVTLYGNPYTQFKIRTREIVNRFLFNKLISETKLEDIPKHKKTILFTLHKQPEASIDVIGRYYENQWTLIKNVWRIMPSGYVLLVKEHSNAIGDRNMGFYKKVKALKNTFLIDHKVNSYKILESCAAVFTVSGTIAYEAALMGKRSFTFAPTFFNNLKGCSEVSWKDFRNRNIFEEGLDESSKMDIQEFSKWLLHNSFEGIMSDSHGDPRCMHKSNIENLSRGFLTIIS